MRGPVRCFEVFSAVLRNLGNACFILLCTLGLSLTARAQEPCITTFDVPASNGYGTQPVGINNQGTIAGYYQDSNAVYHGFLRSPDGNFTTLDAPGAGTNPNASNGTFPLGINQLGIVAGYINDSTGVSYGFVRSPDGKFTMFSAPGADKTPADALGTIITGINALGATSGYYFDTTASHVIHGFLVSPDGQFTSFEAPGSGGLGTVTDGPLNLEGAIVGYYTDPSYLFHGFVRNPDGTIATFVGPGSCNTGYTTSSCYGTGAFNINVIGISVGAYLDNSGNFVSHQFLRSPDGTITTFEAPGAGTGPYQGTGFDQIAGLNDLGVVTSMYLDGNNVYHGYLRTPDGKFATFDAPGADLTPGDYNGTFPASINNAGVITGYYTDVNDVQHGFLRIP
jgi:hypothetical protein